MNIAKHFRTQTATIDYIIADFSFNRIGDKGIFLRYCVEKRLQKLNEQYDAKLDRILTFIITYCDYDNLPLESLSKILLSLTKVTNVLMKGFTAIVGS